MKRQKIDATAFAVVAEGHLNLDDPPIGFEQLFRVRLERGVTGVEQPIELSATPPRVDAHMHPQRRADLRERAAGEAHRSMALELGDGASADPGARCQIGLPPSKPMSDGPDNDVYRPRHGPKSDPRRLSGRLPAGYR